MELSLVTTSDQFNGGTPVPLALPGTTVQTLEKYYESRLPTTRRTVVLYQPTPATMASQMDVDMAHAILSGADLGDTPRYFQLCEDIILMDNHIQGELGKRKLALLGDPRQIVPEDDKNAVDKKAADIIKQQLDSCPAFFDACGALLDSCLWPVALVEKLYKPSRTAGLAYDLVDLVRVPYWLLDYSTQRLRLRDVDAEGNVLGTTQVPDPMRYVVHRGHLLTSPDQRGGPMRSLIFWWLFSTMDRDWWARFLDKFGSPFLVGKFDASDDYSRVILQNAFQTAAKIGGIVVNRQTEVELNQASGRDSGEAFELFHRTARAEISQLIIGQASQQHAMRSSMGNGQGQQQERVRGDLRQFDALKLADTLKFQLFDPFLRLNRIPGNVVIRWGAEAAEDTEKTANSIYALAQAGIELADDGIDAISERFGLNFQRKATPPPTLPPGMPGALPIGGNPKLGAPTGGAPKPGSPKGEVTTLSAPPPKLADVAHQLDAANAQIARAGSADLSRAFGEALGPLHVLVMTSSSAADLEYRLGLFAASYPTVRVQPLIEEALEAFTAQGAGTAQ